MTLPEMTPEYVYFIIFCSALMWLVGILAIVSYESK